MGSVLRFTLVMGPLSSLFDLLAFAWLALGLHADIQPIRTAWIVESITTQILVIFVIRTAGPVWRSRPHRALVATSLGGLALALLIALTPVGAVVGFGPLPPTVLLGMGAISVGYLALAEALKRLALGPVGRRRRSRAARS